MEVGLQAGLCNQVGIGCIPLLQEVANWALSSGQAFSRPHSWVKLGIVLCGHVKLLSRHSGQEGPRLSSTPGQDHMLGSLTSLAMFSNPMGHLCCRARHGHRLFSLAAQGHCLVYLTLWGQRLCSTDWTGLNLFQIKVNSSCLKAFRFEHGLLPDLGLEMKLWLFLGL